MAFALDSDTFRLITDGHAAVTRHLTDALSACEIVMLSAVAAEEAVQGALGSITSRQKQANATAEQVELAYDLLTRTLDNISKFPLLPYIADAERLFRSFPASVKRVGAGDCRIAASAIVSGFTIVTCNTRDYARIPGAVFVDWASAETGEPSVPPILSQNVE